MTTDTTPVAPHASSPVPVTRPLGWFPTWMVGRRYYSLSPLPTDVTLHCEREPDNLSDPDAVAVYAPQVGKIGHLPRYDAAYLAPLLDRAAVRVTARLALPTKTTRTTAPRSAWRSGPTSVQTN